MKIWKFLFATATIAIASPALAASGDSGAAPAADQDAAPAKASAKAFSTGVAKGRDLLDTAISASSIDEQDILNLGTPAVVGIIGNIPGFRAESSGTDGFSAVSVRGLPLAADGTKFVQIQEDGLPVLEFGDIHFASVDQFVRPDLGLSQIQAIRGGSASTFASNSPGGVINFISKTGEETGGAVMVTAGLDHDLKRLDFDYGAQLGGGWRFHVGGFYREGEGPRAVGYTAFKGGQVKLNVTRQFDNGYIRFNAKYLDDRQPNYALAPVMITGTNDAPVYANVPGFDPVHDSLASQYTTSLPGFDQNNRLTTNDARNGNRGVVKSLGAEAQFDIAGWTVSEKFRYAAISGEYNEAMPLILGPSALIGMVVAGPGATFSYASGPNAGQVITNPATLNGNGLLSYTLNMNARLNDMGNVTNDLRLSRVWELGEGKLTTTAGVYYSSQNIDMYWNFASVVQDVVGGGNSALVDVYTAGGTPMTQDGVYAYGIGIVAPISKYHLRYDASFRVTAPYASLNYQIGKFALGGSVRFDNGHVTGRVFGADLGGGRNGDAAFDFSGDGVISAAEARATILPLSQPGNVNYKYDYVSYSVGVNYRLANEASVFARYSKGGRAGADRILSVPTLDPASGGLTDPSVAYAPVKQAEIGFKYRKPGLTVFVTGFWASTVDKNYQIGADAGGSVVVFQIDRTYDAKGVELESIIEHGPFSLSLGATYAKSTIKHDAANPAIEGNRPRHQPSLFFSARPQFDSGPVTLGATINGTTSSYAQDVNLLKQPGYVVVSPFIQFRPAERVELSLNAWNVFDKLGVVQVSAAAVPAGGLSNAQVINGRTLTASLRFNF
ncbi:TonB-dependent receptor domain-containing protein [Novosphingobium sp.]|uniref:TonB-dependent receptor domain-containing protein n=1 Tax=Novosphingobium sp. TaxID=1874826 RepID=UPI0035B32818